MGPLQCHARFIHIVITVTKHCHYECIKSSKDKIMQKAISSTNTQLFTLKSHGMKHTKCNVFLIMKMSSQYEHIMLACLIRLIIRVMAAWSRFLTGVNTSRPRQNGRRFADDTFKRIFLNENVRISIKISLKFVPKGPINNNPALVQIMAWRRSDVFPLNLLLTKCVL